MNQVSQRRATVQAQAFKPTIAHLSRSSRVGPTRAVAVEAPASATTHATHDAPAFRAHLDFKFVKENVDMVATNCKNRFSNADPHKVVALYDEFVALKSKADALRAERNENSAAMKGKLEADKRAALIARGQELKDELAAVETTLDAVESALQREGQRVPNLTHPAVPLGGEEHAAVLKEVGSQRQFPFPVKDHVALAEALDMVDFESAAEVSGQKFYYLRNAGALLELALVNYAFNKVVSKGFTPIMTPDLVKASVLEKCGFQPRGAGTQIYAVQDSPLCLTGTAEVPLGGVYMDRILPEEALPVRMAAFGHCFRTEAGAAGMAGKGLYRVHQFSKVEMFVLATPEQSDALHQELIDIEADMFEELGLHFKVLDMPSGDLGAPAYRKFDVEAWMPGLNRYGEISSASNCTDYQSRRLNIRYRPSTGTPAASDSDSEAPAAAGGKKGGKKGGGKKGGGSGGGKTEFVHTLNATACAVPRMIVAILENFQQEDGSVVVPVPLRPYLGGMEVIRPPAKKH
ncbi:hypothetical protein HYH03_007735 [Edaphochlamys debaryana]|uniref:serine--tRNA ligase n=1 Tax=Edaphochlamys debaryana TaxID=47281 RepID=A0A836BYQ8_9CHLO|nr:hypothetical protein HYH03_007735 [Edaphochlamys debaryana]|eukprot:KAG2494096.1 hypothetical protein HYH03_007735 [Edaphochlamys debaryana]